MDQDQGGNRHEAAFQAIVADMQRAQAEAAHIDADAIAAEIIGQVLRQCGAGSPPGAVHRGFMQATMWLMARGTDADEDFYAAVMAFQTMMGVMASRGRTPNLQVFPPP